MPAQMNLRFFSSDMQELIGLRPTLSVVAFDDNFEEDMIVVVGRFLLISKPFSMMTTFCDYDAHNEVLMTEILVLHLVGGVAVQR